MNRKNRGSIGFLKSAESYDVIYVAVSVLLLYALNPTIFCNRILKLYFLPTTHVYRLS